MLRHQNWQTTSATTISEKGFGSDPGRKIIRAINSSSQQCIWQRWGDKEMWGLMQKYYLEELHTQRSNCPAEGACGGRPDHEPDSKLEKR